MVKTLIITESQKKLILNESVSDEFISILKKNYEFTKRVLKQSSEQVNLNLEFLLTWGASIGGFMRPLNDFISGKYPELSDIELSLIITGVIAIYFADNRKMVSTILNRIKEDGLYKPFKDLLNKSEELQSVFLDFVGSLNITLHKVTNIISYAFIIPLISIIYESISSGIITNDNAKEIALRLSAFGLLTISGIIVRELIIKLIKRFRGPGSE
jgi:hypothetical protein